MKTLLLKYRRTLFIIPAILFLAATSFAQTRTIVQNDLYSTISEHIKKSGYNYKKLTDQGWLITYKSESVLVGVQKDFMIVGIIVARKGEFEVNSDSMFEMLRLANDLDYVKVAIDDDEDLVVRAEWKGKVMEQSAFYDMVTSVTEAAKQARQRVASFEASVKK